MVMEASGASPVVRPSPLSATAFGPGASGLGAAAAALLAASAEVPIRVF